MPTLRLAILAALAVLPGHVLAGDAATPQVLGFTEDGTVFAFEEYGVQDGSGFPYANRFYIDTDTDSFVPGSPIRVRIDDESADLGAARDQARQQGQAIVPDAQLSPGFQAGWNAVTELSADPERIVVLPGPVFPTIDGPVEFRIENVPLATPASCENLGEIMGFRLVRIDPTPGGATVLIHEDASVPASRRCPTGYRIGGVQTLHPSSGNPVVAVIIAVRSVGFEGPDHRWMAVTGRL